MEEIEDILPELQAVISRYLDGEVEFGAAATTLASIVRRTIPTAAESSPAQGSPPVPARIHLRQLSVSQWMDPAHPYIPTAHLKVVKTLSLAPGRSAEDEARAQDLFREALASRPQLKRDPLGGAAAWSVRTRCPSRRFLHGGYTNV